LRKNFTIPLDKRANEPGNGNWSKDRSGIIARCYRCFGAVGTGSNGFDRVKTKVAVKYVDHNLLQTDKSFFLTEKSSIFTSHKSYKTFETNHSSSTKLSQTRNTLPQLP
jgi:hypothetical protein